MYNGNPTETCTGRNNGSVQSTATNLDPREMNANKCKNDRTGNCRKSKSPDKTCRKVCKWLINWLLVLRESRTSYRGGTWWEHITPEKQRKTAARSTEKDINKQRELISFRKTSCEHLTKTWISYVNYPARYIKSTKGNPQRQNDNKMCQLDQNSVSCSLLKHSFLKTNTRWSLTENLYGDLTTGKYTDRDTLWWSVGDQW